MNRRGMESGHTGNGKIGADEIIRGFIKVIDVIGSGWSQSLYWNMKVTGGGKRGLIRGRGIVGYYDPVADFISILKLTWSDGYSALISINGGAFKNICFSAD